MRGFTVNIATQDDTTGIRFRLYDNAELVIDNIGTLDFEYLVGDPYVGEHALAITYFREVLPDIESDPQEFYRENFTLPILELTVTAEVF
jgi:hypothetical protein